jgi:exopolysaccharide biosynthesis polyprenyl glycosylphosphotransferase
MRWRSPWLRRRGLLIGLAAFDLFIVFLTYIGIYYIRFNVWPGISISMSALAGLWLGLSYLLGRYSPQRRLNTQLRQIIQDSTAAAVLLIVVAVMLRWGMESNDSRTVKEFILPCLAIIGLSSVSAQIWARLRLKKPQHWILVGEHHELNILQWEIERDLLGAQFQLIVFDAAKLDHKQLTLVSTPVRGIAVSEQSDLDEEVIEWLIARRAEGVRILTLINWAEQVLQRVPPELFTLRWLLDTEGFELQPERFGWRLKRLGDVLAASILLIASLPVIMISTLLIRLQDGGPMFYSQYRTGLYGERIRIRKLRSMKVNAEANGAQWAKASDNRITPLGRWLRRLRLDELPQLINVIKGEMSLIGPRPERPELDADLESIIPHYRVRHWILPGLSGWAQVCYPYGASLEDSRQKLSYDLYYIRNANLALDILILLKTVRMILRGQGAEPTSKTLHKID